MAGEVYIGTDDQGRPRYRDRAGRLMPPEFRPESRTPSGKVTSKVSERSRSLIGDAIDSLTGAGIYSKARQANKEMRRGVDAVRGIGGMVGDYGTARNEFIDANRMDYGGPDAYIGSGGAFSDAPRYREGFDTTGDPNAPFRLRVAGDAEKILKGMDPGVLARLQDRLQAAGYMAGGAFAPGNSTDNKTVEAFKGLLAFANTQGMVWHQALQETERVIKETGVGADEAGAGAGPAPFVTEAYLAPDYDAIEDSVYGLMRDQLGRDPDDSELAILASQFSGLHRDAWEKNVEAQRMDYENQVQASEEGTEGLGGATVEGAMDSADLAGKFRQLFRERFSAERSGIERQEQSSEQEDLVEGAVSTLSRMTGGMG